MAARDSNSAVDARHGILPMCHSTRFRGCLSILPCDDGPYTRFPRSCALGAAAWRRRLRGKACEARVEAARAKGLKYVFKIVVSESPFPPPRPRRNAVFGERCGYARTFLPGDAASSPSVESAPTPCPFRCRRKAIRVSDRARVLWRTPRASSPIKGLLRPIGHFIVCPGKIQKVLPTLGALGIRCHGAAFVGCLSPASDFCCFLFPLVGH